MVGDRYQADGVAAQEKGGDIHEEGAASSADVKPHATSMAVWDVASPVVVDTAFKLKVGVKCSAGCNLAGEEIEIYDHEGVKIATGTLGDVPYADRVDLYWAEVEVTAPATKGAYRWEAVLAQPRLETPHREASYKFGFSSAERPEHTVTVEVVDQETEAPVANARVMLRPYSSRTDESGMATLAAAGGEYKLDVTKEKYDTFATTVTVTGDASIRVELEPSLYREDYRGNLWKVERNRSARRR